MPRPLDQIVRDTLGNQALQIAELTAQLEVLQEELSKLKAQEKQDESNCTK